MVTSLTSKVIIRAAEFPADKEIVSQLFLEYAQSLPMPLDLQGFEEELARLPGKYAVEKAGAIFLAYTTNALTDQDEAANEQETIIGVVALRSFATSNTIPTCELKRLYLAPSSRGLGVSKKLMDVVVARARELDNKEMLLDTLSSMTAARRLYEGYGFVEIESYYQSVEDAVFYKLVL
ncbi:acyl-CoA N-acyltransferase [Phaeosphaeria sp. MPI-PUGE-AT-0046c]|nr:acyl-CoA N-acyltransferase [Phaeosphaeria sp. MPI-PUGE-AT-0046c]